MTKLQDVFVSLAGPILDIVSPIVDMLLPALRLIPIILEPVFFIFRAIGDAVQGFTDLISGDLKDGLDFFQQILQSIAVIYGGIVAFQKIQNLELIKNIGLNKVLGSILSANFWKDIGVAIANIWGKIIGFLGPFGIPVAIAASAGLVGLATSFFSKGDDIFSPGDNMQGYGKRTLMGPEGAIALNDDDTVIAGTNLMGGKGKKESPIPTLNLNPVINVLKEQNIILNKILEKNTDVHMDGNKVGTQLALSNPRMQ